MLLADTDVVALTYYPASSDNDCSHARVRAGHAPSLLGEGQSPLHELSIMLVERHNKTPWPSVQGVSRIGTCLLYTSDAADDLLCVDLGGRRIIKKKKKRKRTK